MLKQCDMCRRDLEDGDEIVAAVVTVFRMVTSRVSYAVDKPTACLRMIHIDCFAGASDGTKDI
jgi:hypothetical protein